MTPISHNGRSAYVICETIGRYGNKWRSVTTSDGRHFEAAGRPILPPPEWKVLVWVQPIIRPLLPRNFRVVKATQ